MHFLVRGSHSVIIYFKHWHLCARGMGLDVRAESPAATVKGILTARGFGSSCAKSFLPRGVCCQAVDSVRANYSECFVVSRSSLLKHSYDTVWGFVSRFPVILSIENHCSIQQQKKIAQYLKEILGDKLDLSSVVTGDSRQLPSPQNLKGKILVKVICYLWHIENPTGGSAWYLLCVFGSEE